jgi:hypothetical protein
MLQLKGNSPEEPLMKSRLNDIFHPPESKSSYGENAALAVAFLGLTASTMINLLAICSDDLRSDISDKIIIGVATAVGSYIILWAFISQSWEIAKSKDEKMERMIGEFKATLFLMPIMQFFIVGIPVLFFMYDEHSMFDTVSTALTESFLLFSSLTVAGVNIAQEMNKKLKINN